MDTRARLAEHFPVFALEIRTPRLTLRYPDDDDLVTLAELATEGVHDPDRMPFTVQWTAVDPPFQQRNTLEFFWGQRATAQHDDWCIPLATVVDGEIVGSQGIMGRHWKGTRSFETGSWLGRAHHGRGIGTEMRRAVLHLGFEGFGAARATTAAFADNPSSLTVTERLGYRPNGSDLLDRNGEPVELHRFVMDRTDWEARRTDDVEVVGAAAVRDQFGTLVAPPVVAT